MSKARRRAASQPSAVHRTVDTLGRMLEAGTISEPMSEAGRTFQQTFVFVHTDPLRSSMPARIPGRGNAGGMDCAVEARRRLTRALDALGGLDSPGGSCCWHVLGHGLSLREWALRQGWCGRSVRQEQAQGILIAALGMLAAHYGYERRPARGTGL